MNEPIDKESYDKNLAILERNASLLRGSNVGIDALVELNVQSRDAYKVCISRLDAVEAAVKQISMDIEE